MQTLHTHPITKLSECNYKLKSRIKTVEVYINLARDALSMDTCLHMHNSLLSERNTVKEVEYRMFAHVLTTSNTKTSYVLRLKTYTCN